MTARVLSIFLIYWACVSITHADVVLDGSLGAIGPLAGPDFMIDAVAGRTVGTNLFHSFGEFNLSSSQSAKRSAKPPIMVSAIVVNATAINNTACENNRMKPNHSSRTKLALLSIDGSWQRAVGTREDQWKRPEVSRLYLVSSTARNSYFGMQRLSA